jgi:uncharacterized protein YqeY
MHQNIQAQIKEALMAKDAVRLTTLRGILSAFTNESVALKRTPQDKLKDDEALAVLKRLAKQRKDSIEQFEKASRADLADNEKAELKIIEEFLPEEVGEDIIRNIVMSKKEELGVTDKSKMGILIGAVMKDPKAAGADGALVKKIVEELIK